MSMYDDILNEPPSDFQNNYKDEQEDNFKYVKFKDRQIADDFYDQQDLEEDDNDYYKDQKYNFDNDEDEFYNPDKYEEYDDKEDPENLDTIFEDSREDYSQHSQSQYSKQSKLGSQFRRQDSDLLGNSSNKSDQQYDYMQQQYPEEYEKEFLQKSEMKKYEFDKFSDVDTVSGISSSFQQENHQEDYEFMEQQRKRLKDTKENFWQKKKKMQKEFEGIVNQQSKIFEDRQRIKNLSQQVNYKFKNVDQNQMKDIIKEIEDQDQDYISKNVKPKKYQHKYQKKDMEQLQHDIEFYKKQHNEDQALIKMLKVELRKLSHVNPKQVGAKTNNFMSDNNSQISTCSSNSSSKMTMDQLIKQNEDLQNELKSLKTLMSQQTQESKSNMSRMQKLNLELQKGYMKEVRDLEKKSNIKTTDEKLFFKIRKQEKIIYQQRIQIDQLIKDKEVIQKKCQEKDNEIGKLAVVRNEKTVIKQDFKIQELEKQVKNIEKDKEEIKIQYGLDKQLQLLFPKNCQFLGKIMNGVLIVEELENNKEGRAFSSIVKGASPIHKFLKQGVQRFADYAKFYKSKQIIDHPQYKEIAKAQIKLWNQNPNIIVKEINSNQQEIQQLKDQVLMLLKDKDQLSEIIEGLNNDVDMLQRRNSIIEDKLNYDRTKLARQLVLFYMAQEKGQEEMECFEQLKDYIDILEQVLPKTTRQQQKEIKEEKERKLKEEQEQKNNQNNKNEQNSNKKKLTYNYLKPLKRHQKKMEEEQQIQKENEELQLK